MTTPYPKRFHSLDALRGGAALAVVFWHWRHFFMRADTPAVNFAELPLHRVFYLPYHFGWLAIYLFFSLSGFIFYWLYAESIAAKSVGVRAFVALRFSRLYPLHLATLLLVAVGQALFVRLASHPFVYTHNDGFHFGLNLFFAQSWGFEKGYSFNGPVWSVSVEVLLYAVFFILCRLLPVRLPVLLTVALAGFCGVSRLDGVVGKGIAAFFLGGAAYLLYARIVRTARIRETIFGLTSALILLWPLSLWIRIQWPQANALPTGLRAGFPPLRVFDLFEAEILLVLFPATILWLAMLETRGGSPGKRLAFLGDLSYSSYLLHFPLQLVFMLVTTALAWPRSFYGSPFTLALFFALLIPLSLACHRGFERPAQRFLRRRLLPRPPSNPAGNG